MPEKSTTPTSILARAPKSGALSWRERLEAMIADGMTPVQARLRLRLEIETEERSITEGTFLTDEGKHVDPLDEAYAVLTKPPANEKGTP